MHFSPPSQQCMRAGSREEVRNSQRSLQCHYMKTRFCFPAFMTVHNLICRSPVMEIRILNSPWSKDPLACLVTFTQKKHHDIPPDTCNTSLEIEYVLSWHIPPVFRNCHEWSSGRWKFWRQYNCHPPWQSLSQVSIQIIEAMIHLHNRHLTPGLAVRLMSHPPKFFIA